MKLPQGKRGGGFWHGFWLDGWVLDGMGWMVWMLWMVSASGWLQAEHARINA